MMTNRAIFLACLVAFGGVAQAEQAFAASAVYSNGAAGSGGGDLCNSASGCGSVSGSPSILFAAA